MSLTWNFSLILFLCSSLGVFPPRPPKYRKSYGVLSQGFELAAPKESIMNVQREKKKKGMLYFALREGPEPSQIEGSNSGVVLLQVRENQLLAILGGRSHAVAANAVHMIAAQWLLQFSFALLTTPKRLFI